MDLISALGAPGAGLAVGAAAGTIYLAAAVVVKRVQDRSIRRRGGTPVSDQRSFRAAAREQAKLLGQQARVQAGVPTGGQFAARQRGDSDIHLG